VTAFLRRYFDGGGATTTLSTAMGSADTSFVLAAATNWPGAAANNFVVVIDRGTSSEEKILCTSNSGTTVTVASSGRGYDDTSATTHNASATVSLCLSAIDADEANQVTNLLGNAATGSLIIGAGAGTLPTKLAVGSATSILAGGTTPAYVSASNGQFFGVTGGAVAAVSLTVPIFLTTLSKSSSYAAVNGNFVNMTATGTITSPAAASGSVFGVIANYGATNASPVTLTTASGYFIGLGIPASTSSILLGAQGATVSFYSDGTNWYLSSGAQDSGWITASLTNSWTSAGPVPQYRLIANRVLLRGELNASSGSSGTAAFTLASGYRPTQLALMGLGTPASSFPGIYTAIQTSGAVDVEFSSTAACSFDGLSFTVD
jgi:hypothetical protein